MNERKMQFRVGVVVLFTVLIALMLVMVNGPLPSGWLPWGRGQYRINIDLPKAPGVSPGTPVHKNGILIGRVESVNDLEDRVVVTAKIDQDRKLYSNTDREVRTSVLGDATIEFVSRPPKPGEEEPHPLADGETVSGEVKPNPVEAISALGENVRGAVDSLQGAGDEVEKLAKRINEVLGDETEEGRVSKLMDKTENAMDEFAQTMSSVNDILGGASVEDRQMRQRLRQGLNELPDAIREARVTMQNFNVVLDSANKNLHNLEGFTEPLGRNGEQIARAIIDSVEGLDKLVEEFTVLTQALNSREGTLGQLIHNPELYNNLSQLIANANYVVVRVNDLTARLRPVIEDARVFMDKIAREPGRIVGGALNRGPGIK